MSKQEDTQAPRDLDLLSSLLISGLSVWALNVHAPLFEPQGGGAAIRLLPGLAAFTLTASVMHIASRALHFISDRIDLMLARLPYGLHGSGGFATLDDIRGELSENGVPYFGAKDGEALTLSFESNAFCVAPAGSGKTTSVAVNSILSILDSAIVTDGKSGELACLLKKPLEARGQEVLIVNLSALHEKRLGESACYNPLLLIYDHLMGRKGGLETLWLELRMMALQLHPVADDEKGSENAKFFSEGAAGLVGTVIIVVVLIKGENATFGDVWMALNNPEYLLHTMLFVSGELLQEGDGPIEARMAALPIKEQYWAKHHDPDALTVFERFIRNLAASWVQQMSQTENRTYQSFLTSAQTALLSFNPTTAIHRVMSKSTFRFADLKQGKAKTVFIVGDATHSEALKPVMGMLIFCASRELQQHENLKRPVYIIAEEASNCYIDGLATLLTTLRGFGVRMHLFFQNFSAFVKTYDEHTLSTVLSECEVQQFLPGQREPRVLEHIEKTAGTCSIVTQSYKGERRSNTGGIGNAYDFREEKLPVITADQVRRCRKAITFIRQHKPLLHETPSYAAIHPYRDQVDTSPFHDNKRFLQPIELRMNKKRKS